MANKRFNKRVMAIVLCAAAGFLLLATGHAAESIKLGVAGVHSGELAPYGISGLRGVELAVEHINAQGGLLNRLIELIVEDDLCKPKEAVNIATKLVVKGVHAVI